MDVRWAATVVFAGLVLPVATVLLVIGAAIQVGFPPVLTLLLLGAGPLLAIASTYVLAAQSDVTVPLADRLPFGGGPTQFRDQIPDRHHETFAPETLDAPTGDDDPNTLVTAYLVYLASVPVYTLIVWLVVLG